MVGLSRILVNNGDTLTDSTERQPQYSSFCLQVCSIILGMEGVRSVARDCSMSLTDIIIISDEKQTSFFSRSQIKSWVWTYH